MNEAETSELDFSCAPVAKMIGLEGPRDSTILCHTRTAMAATVDQLLSWRTGYLAFENTPLDAAVAEFNRYNKLKIIIADPKLADLRIGGHFRSTNTDGFLWLLQTGFPVSVEKDGGSVRLKAR